MEVVNIKRQEKASLIFHVSTHALAGPLESLQAVICNLYYASSPEKKVSTQRYQERFFFLPAILLNLSMQVNTLKFSPE